MMGLYLLFPVPHILLCVVTPVDSMSGHPGSILGCPQLPCVGLYRILTSSFMLASRPAVVGGAAVLIY